jgi:hypothetical protein
MNEYLVRYTGERSEERVLADAYVHDLFDVVFTVKGLETRRVAVAEISNVRLFAGVDSSVPEVQIAPIAAVREITQKSQELAIPPEIQPPDTFPRVERSPRSGPRYRNLPIAGHGADTYQVDDVRE